MRHFAPLTIVAKSLPKLFIDCKFYKQKKKKAHTHTHTFFNKLCVRKRREGVWQRYTVLGYVLCMWSLNVYQIRFCAHWGRGHGHFWAQLLPWWSLRFHDVNSFGSSATTIKVWHNHTSPSKFANKNFIWEVLPCFGTQSSLHIGFHSQSN
jgi:hypothetical protein